MISHRNVVANALQGIAAFDTAAGPTTSVGWLPLFHDMGLVLSIAEPIVAGFPSVLMDPVAFLEKPERWLRLLGAYPGALSAAPNFAYEYCAAAVGPEQVADLRLDRVRALLNGSEPVRASTVRRFQQAFGAAGLPPQSQCPSYGLAEATVFVATNGPADAPLEVLCSRDALSEGRIVAVPDGADQQSDDAAEEAVTSLVGCGVPVGQELRIIDPATKAPVPQDVVGEIVLRGPNVGLGYWKRAEQSAEVFGVAVPGTGDLPWLRTGDLGAIHQGQLLVTGRLKDLLIVDGRNHYPQDVEESVQTALDCVRKGRIAVFSVPGTQGELAVAVAEHRRDLAPDEALRDTAERTARARIAEAHGLRLHRLVLVSPGSVPRTSSGKVSRSACRTAFLHGEYEVCSAAQPERGAVQ
jgi:acyl-CoA synthetase (AMP-forming)/AMP-acid ligase II